MKTRNEIKSEIREKHYYLYYGDTLLGFGIILGFVLGFTIFKDSSQFHEFLGILIFCYILVALYKLGVTRKYYLKHNRSYKNEYIRK
jgi:purine-cytosine permease-like protein